MNIPSVRLLQATRGWRVRQQEEMRPESWLDSAGVAWELLGQSLSAKQHDSVASIVGVGVPSNARALLGDC